MIAQARTPRALCWAARLGVLGLAALILPLAPTWAQSPGGAASPDRAPDSAAAQAREKLQQLTRELREARDELARQRLKPKAEADDDDDNRPETADHLETLFKELGDTLSKDLGPVGEEILKALEKATREVSDALGKDGIISKDLREALERAGDQLSQAFKEGGPLNEQARDAAEKARQDMRQAVEKAREELRRAVRDRVDKTRDMEGLLSRPGDKPKDEPAAEAEGPAKPGDVEQARKEVRQMEQELRRAMRRLEAIERREQRLSRNPRRSPIEPPPQPPAPPHPPAAPENAEGRPTPPPGPEAPATPEAGRPFRGPLERRMGPDGRPLGMRGPVPPALNPRVERRLQDLESKMDRLLKELESLKNEKKDKSREHKESGATL